MSQPMDEDKKAQVMSQEAYFDTAIRAVRQKKPVPEIDFTLHTMDDGTQVNTLERVCKGMAFQFAWAHTGVGAWTPTDFDK